MSFTPSPVVATTIAQLRALGAIPAGAKLVQVNENTVRVSKTRGRKTRNVDIAYNPVFDLYDVTIHAITFPTPADVFAGKSIAIVSREVTMVYADQLADAVLAWKAEVKEAAAA